MFEIQVSSISASSLKICISSWTISVQDSLVEISAMMAKSSVCIGPYHSHEFPVSIASLE